MHSELNRSAAHLKYNTALSKPFGLYFNVLDLPMKSLIFFFFIERMKLEF